MVYDELVLRGHYDSILIEIPKKGGGDINDKGGVDRQHWEGGQNLESVSRESPECFYRMRDEGVEEG